ncbi:hypothetical protein COU17_01105 [Candidatus Kaiserbacteria bacterium CG10_big_fil_rev_8_21_14_0_10_49_17]|uniref:Type II secretion system protein GspG C-terminal domain-containing protein n=1 Tax=Candidatus Kaiserbacteria bacterium CG10_big_fil_rev_8_21_14_0_10_49_17 TaxID=1974609 RepID=A0A2M6WF44_9BACT|nr:MAG: hypothetical protein COU17_01105 [Candidatus Kaiserbacteria bacterium CG10_big_fil_rev_8_21_14_0_10_49_17]
MRNGRGFTLIELLVVIAIIGLLSSVVLASLNSARAKARDARRVSDLKQLQLALELYYDSNGSYPNPGWGWRSECNAWGGYSPENVIPGLTPAYISVMPSDPGMDKSANKCCYLYLSNGAEYKLLDHDCPGDGGINYTSQPNLIDPLRDGGSNGCIMDGSNIWSWAVWSGTNAICW